MRIRVASCRCGQLRATCTGEPVRVSVCHCLECQKRSGSAFAVQARWPDAQVELAGAFQTWSQAGDNGAVARFHFCATCGATVTYASGGMPGLTAVAVGAFADPTFPPPGYSVWEDRKHSWVSVSGECVEHFA
jgi:hypothetical protein